MTNEKQSLPTCKDCPDWDPFDYKNAKEDPGTPRGRCKFNPPALGDPCMLQFFPIVEENNWCRPGRDKMQAEARAKAAKHVPVEPQAKGYDEF